VSDDVNVVVIVPMSEDALASIRAVDARLRVVDAWELFGPEIAADWPRHTAEWYLPPRFLTARDENTHDDQEQRARRDAVLADAEAVCITFPFPARIAGRAPRLRFVHQLPAGVSNLAHGDLWHSSIPITSGRGAGNTLPIAEWAIAAAMALCKDFPRAFEQRADGHFDRRVFQGHQIAGKTLAVVGLGGIGRDVARLARALGMRVVGTRRSTEPVEHVDRLFAPHELPAMLGESDVVVVAAQLTPKTHHLLNEGTIGAMKPGALLLNVARGELIDEAAVIAALRSGHLGGFATDVYQGEFEHQPPAELLAQNNVLLTPHTSGHVEQFSQRPLEIFRENLRRCLDGQPLLNQVDWERGY